MVGLGVGRRQERLRGGAARAPLDRGDRACGCAATCCVACVADEEGVSIGTEDLVKRHTMDACIVMEPDGLPKRDRRASRVRMDRRDRARQWRPTARRRRRAIDAIVHMAEVVRRLDRLDREVFAKTTLTAENGKTVFHTGTLQAGTDYATYPSRAVLGIEIGTQPGEHLSDRVREIEAIFAELSASLRGFSRRGRREARSRAVRRARGHEPLLAALDRLGDRVIGGRSSRAG